MASSLPVIGFIGCGGVMGKSMVTNILKSGYHVIGYNRTLSKLEGLNELGHFEIAASNVELAKRSDIIILMVGYPADVREVILGEKGVLNYLRTGTTIIDMTTSEPSLAVEIYDKALLKGINSVDAPVSGGDIGAKNATLTIFCGGIQDVINSLSPIFSVIGKSINYCGLAGTGQHTKMCNQILIASTMIGVCESVLYAHKAGLNVENAIKAVSGGAAASWSLSNLAPRMLKRDFEPGFYVEHFIKDLGIVLTEAKRLKLSLPGLHLAYSLYTSVVANNWEKKGTQALLLALEKLNNVEVSKSI